MKFLRTKKMVLFIPILILSLGVGNMVSATDSLSWKEYRNSNLGFKVKYREDLNIITPPSDKMRGEVSFSFPLAGYEKTTLVAAWIKGRYEVNSKSGCLALYETERKYDQINVVTYQQVRNSLTMYVMKRRIHDSVGVTDNTTYLIPYKGRCYTVDLALQSVDPDATRTQPFDPLPFEGTFERMINSFRFLK